MQERVEKAIQNIRPFLQRDGGDIELIEIKDGVVKVRLRGACSGCPMSQLTIQEGVERALKRDVPEIVRVEAVD